MIFCFEIGYVFVDVFDNVYIFKVDYYWFVGYWLWMRDIVVVISVGIVYFYCCVLYMYFVKVWVGYVLVFLVYVIGWIFFVDYLCF